MASRCCILFAFVIASIHCFSQNPYLKITTYAGIVHPIITFSKDKPVVNFKDFYLVGFPTGINIWKSPTIGYSFEFVPYIRSQNGTSTMSNFLFHPGVSVRLGHNYTFTGRAAFETSGRNGVTPVFTKIMKKNKSGGYYVSVSSPVRLGNEKPTTLSLSIQFGISF